MQKKLGKWGAILFFFVIAHMATGQETDNEQIVALDSADFLHGHAVFVNTAFCNETKIEGTVIGSLNLPSGFFLVLRDNSDTILAKVDCIVAITILDSVSEIETIETNTLPECVSYETHICGMPIISGLSSGRIDYKGETFYMLKSCPQKMTVLVNQRYVVGKINIGCCSDAS